MKLSLSWIFDHIDADWKKININEFINKFNKTTAEIEKVQKVNIDLKNLFIAKVKSISKETVILECPELKKEIELPKKEKIKINDLFLLKKIENHEFDWAKLKDLGSEKEGSLGAIFVTENEISGKWKNNFESEDYIIEIDNAAVTHRPDLWGHRGYAREIAAIFNLKLKPISELITKKQIKNFDKSFSSDSKNPFTIKIEADSCKRFATLFIDSIENKSSNLLIASRLARIDSKPIDFIVDATNYVMFDLSQPMHAFDAQKIKSQTIYAKMARKDDSLLLIDDEEIKLTDQDLIIADTQPISLAGIMGGSKTAVDENTKSLLVESANFEPITIRKSSIRFKKRTESSARFEKNLDPNQNILAIERFLKILENENIKFQSSNEIISLGKEVNEIKINLSNDFIEKRLGVAIKSEFVVETLKKLDFKVEKRNDNFEIIVPTFRSKNITIEEDIVEEIGRFFGFENIPFILPAKKMEPSTFREIGNLRKIKQLMAYSDLMHEVNNYPFFDEDFLKELNWQPQNCIEISNPISENFKRLVTSLIPHLLKNIQQNINKADQLRFFEFNRIWSQDQKNTVEKKSLAGIFFNKNSIDFYDSKTLLNNLFNLLDLPIEWTKLSSANQIENDFYNKYQTADLLFEGKKIGTAGIISSQMLLKISPGDAFIFEIDGDFLLSYNPKMVKFKPISKFQPTWLDISMFVPTRYTVSEITKIIKSVDSRIFDVNLIDRFEKEEWQNKVSLTFRFHIVYENKTLLKEEINEVMNEVIEAVRKIGAEIR